MIYSQVKLKQNKQWITSLDSHIRQHSSWCHVLSDPTRAKILVLLKKNKEMCVSDLAAVLNISISAISHQLSFLENFGAVTSQKTGKTVCYFLNSDDERIIKCLNLKKVVRNNNF